MSMRILIVGAGGHGREVLDIVEALNRVSPGYDFLGYLDDGPVDRELLARRGAALVGRIERLADIDAEYVIAIGSPENRRRIDEYATSCRRRAATLVHPLASIASDVELQPGCVVAAGARLTTNIRMGRHCHVNVNATISHDCRLGDYVTVNPGATVAGNAVIESEATIGAGAVVIQGIRVGRGTYLGAGAVAVRDLPAGVTAVGVPARPLMRDPQ